MSLWVRHSFCKEYVVERNEFLNGQRVIYFSFCGWKGSGGRAHPVRVLLHLGRKKFNTSCLMTLAPTPCESTLSPPLAISG